MLSWTNAAMKSAKSWRSDTEPPIRAYSEDSWVAMHDVASLSTTLYGRSLKM